MKQRVALVLCLACLAANGIFSTCRILALTRRIEAIEAVPSTPRALAPETLPASPIRVAPPDGSTHKVLRIVDGDTVEIGADTGPLKIRVIGIDTPETKHPAKPVEPFGPEATARATDLLQDVLVRIHYDPDPTHARWGKYGRLLAYIALPDGRDFGTIMISEGLAKAYPKYPFSRMSKYLAVEQQATNAKVGMWARVPTANLGSN